MVVNYIVRTGVPIIKTSGGGINQWGIQNPPTYRTKETNPIKESSNRGRDPNGGV